LAWEHNAEPVLLDYGGRPLICYTDTNYGVMLLWAQTTAPDSADDWEYCALDSVTLNVEPPALAVINGLPYVAYIPDKYTEPIYLATPVIKE
jgi:hypothetical protein